MTDANPTAPGEGRTPDAPRQLRGHQWYGTEGLRSFSHRARTRQLGYLPEEHLGKPVIAILNTWSDINPCHVHLRDRAQAVKRGVWQAGGFPLEFPVSTLSETFQKPTPMLYRNMLAMETEELLRSYPVDGAVLHGRLRQVHARASHGRRVGRPAGRLRARRADAARSLAQRDPRLRHRHVEVLGRQACRAHRRLRDGRAGERSCPFARSLHDHGHGVHAHRGGRGPRRHGPRRPASPPSTPGTTGWPPPRG